MREYYFTFGSNETHPFMGGWAVVHAQTMSDAINKFCEVHPKTTDGFINCALIYYESDFKATKMYTNGNFGKFEQEVIE